MSRIAILNLLVIVLLVGVCSAIPLPCTNLRLVRDHPTLLQYHLVWNAPSSTSNSHFRVRCVQGCEAYTSVQWDAYTPSSKVPVDVLLRSHPKGSRAMRESNGVRFVLGVTHVDRLGLESLSVDTILFIDTESKDQHAPREESTSSTSSSSLTSGSTSSTTASLSANSTSNATSSTTGQLTSGTSTSLSTTGGNAGVITINIKFVGNVTAFDLVGYGQVLARALGVPSSLVRVEFVSRKRADSFAVVVRVTYPTGTSVPSKAQVSAALTSPAYVTYLQENSLNLADVNISITYGPAPIPQEPTEPAKAKKQKEGISGGIIAAIVVPIVVVVAVIVAVVIVLRVRRRRWEQRGIELEQIYKSF